MDNVWNYDPISRGLKPFILMCMMDLLEGVWNYDPISRGLKLRLVRMGVKVQIPPFGTMTRFLGD